MAISLPKTLQGTAYTLYLVSEVLTYNQGMVVVLLKGYQSEGCFTDGFLPMITKRETITNSDVLEVFNSLYVENRNLCIQAAEQYLTQSVAYYSGGDVIA